MGNRTGKFGINVEPLYNLHVVSDAYISLALNIDGDFTAPNIYNKIEVDSFLLSKASQSSLNVANSNISALGDNVNNGYTTLSQSLALKSSQANFDFLTLTVANKQDKLNSSSDINIDKLNCGQTIINASSSSSSQFITCEIGSSLSYFQYSHGHHIDTYSRNDDSGRTLNINYYNNSGVRIGNSN